MVQPNLGCIFAEIKTNTLTMATVKKSTVKSIAPKLNVQPSYITLKLPTGNFTTSYSGSKVSGQLTKIKGAFEALDNYVITASKTKTDDIQDESLVEGDFITII